MDAKTRRKVLLAAAIAEVLRQEGAGEEDLSSAWARTGTSHHRSWAWNPRGPGAWRLAGRLQHHGRSRPGRT